MNGQRGVLERAELDELGVRRDLPGKGGETDGAPFLDLIGNRGGEAGTVQRNLQGKVPASGAFTFSQVKVGPDRDVAAKTGQRTHLDNYMVRREAVALGIERIIASIIRLDDAGTETADTGDIVVVDGEESRGIGVACEKLGPCSHHREGRAAPAGFAQHSGAKQIVAQTKRAKEE